MATPGEMVHPSNESSWGLVIQRVRTRVQKRTQNTIRWRASSLVLGFLRTPEFLEPIFPADFCCSPGKTSQQPVWEPLAGTVASSPTSLAMSPSVPSQAQSSLFSPGPARTTLTTTPRSLSGRAALPLHQEAETEAPGWEGLSPDEPMGRVELGRTAGVGALGQLPRWVSTAGLGCIQHSW